MIIIKIHDQGRMSWYDLLSIAKKSIFIQKLEYH